MDTIEKIKYVIEKIRPFLIGDGGDVEFVRYDEETGTVYVRLLGACAECGISDETLSETVESILTSEIPEVLSVKQVIED